MRAWLLFLLVLLQGLAGGRACADVVVVVHVSSDIRQLSHESVVNIFLGRYRGLAGGNAALPIDQPESAALREEFYRRLVKKNLNEINAYWSRLVFSGQTAPPLQVTRAAEILPILANNRNAIAYVERSQVDKQLRVVTELPP